MDTATQPKIELIQVADVVAREKGIERDEVLEAMEQAIQKAGRSKYGHEHDIRASIDRTTGEIRLVRCTQVVEEVDPEDEINQVTLERAQKKDPNLKVGDLIVDPLPPIDFGRIAAQIAKQVIVQEVRRVERTRQFGEFKDRTGEIVNGIVKRVEFGNVTVDLGRAEAILRRDELLPRESFRNGDRVRAYIYDVREEQRGPQIFLSRSHPQFMAKLFTQEVPEIYDNIIEIKAVARDPGSRAKIAVLSHDSSIDPIGAGKDMRLVIHAAWEDTASIALGASIACSGCCLTAVELGADWFAVDVSAETLSCTTMGTWRVGSQVNLERSLKVGDELGGHIVSGHVDGVGRTVSAVPENGSIRWTFG